MPSSRPIDRLREIVENCERIFSYVRAHMLESYARDAKTADAVERCLQRISEAAVKLGNAMDARYPNAPWRNARGVGNILRHRYDEVTHEIVWESIEKDLPSLRDSAQAEMQRLAISGSHEEDFGSAFVWGPDKGREDIPY